MRLERISQILEGKNHHYILINVFKITSLKGKENEPLVLNFLSSKYYKNDYQIDSKKGLSEKKLQEFLPFPFVIERLSSNDFIEIRHKSILGISERLLRIFTEEFTEFQYKSEFSQLFLDNLNYLKTQFINYEYNFNWNILTIDNYN